MKVGVVARGEFIPPGGERPRRRVEDARYVVVLGGQPEFKKGMAAALAVERADDVGTVPRRPRFRSHAWSERPSMP